MKKFLRSKLVLSLVALVMLAGAILIPFLRSHTPAAHAASGDFVSEVTFSQDCQNGIGVDGSKTIYHYSTTGTLLGSSTWAGAAAGSSCYNSGLGLGGSIMYQGSDGCSHVYATDKATPSGPVLFDFSTAVASDPNFRD